MATTYLTAASLDGFLATPDHGLDWLFAVPTEPETDAWLEAFGAGVGAYVMGASTYRWIVEHEDLVAHPQKWPALYPAPVWVLTHRDQPVVPGADVRFTSAPIVQVHAEARAAAADRDVWVMGGGDVAGQVLDAGLLDRVVVTIAPATLGAGAPLLPRQVGSDRLELVDAVREGQLVTVTYDVRPG